MVSCLKSPLGWGTVTGRLWEGGDLVFHCGLKPAAPKHYWCSLRPAHSNRHFAWLMLIAHGTGDLRVLFRFPALVFLFSSSFFIYSHKSPRVPHISHFTCFPGYFQIRGSDNSPGGVRRTRLPCPSPYLVNSNEKDWQKPHYCSIPLRLWMLIGGSLNSLSSFQPSKGAWQDAYLDKETRKRILAHVSPRRQVPQLREADKHRIPRVCLHSLRAM